jgi:hypothetical protein
MNIFNILKHMRAMAKDIEELHDLVHELECDKQDEMDMDNYAEGCDLDALEARVDALEDK